ncbi:MAG: TraU family protein [Gallionella sp.]|nr:TraU family protein [Gallionella sp.]
MNSVFRALLLASCLLSVQPARASLECQGTFPNLITDICWSCAFPIRLGGGALTLPVSLGQEDTPNPGGLPVCTCGLNAGVKVSFWEPARHVDVVRKPFCMSTLGGIDMNPGFDAPHATQTRKDNSDTSSFYQVHWYVNPVFTLLEAVVDSACLEQQVFDVAYLTELDPLWNDDEMTSILNPDSFLFGNLVSGLACGADCVASTAGFGSNALFWCAGCQGRMYPLNGHVASHVGGVQASSLLVLRIIAKMHREGLMWAASGDSGLCGYYPQLLMDKTNYKYQMLFPVAQNKIDGKCCQPLGRTTAIWGSGKEIPAMGEDFTYMVFRKRNCCQGAF